MSLTNEQYDKIIKTYTDTRSAMENRLQERREYVLLNVAGYKELDDAMTAYALERTRRVLMGDSLADDAEQTMDGFAAKKRALLVSSGLPEDYLEPIYVCPDCKDTGFIDRAKCRCFKQKEATVLYEQSNLEAIFSQASFDKLSFDYYQGEDLDRFKKATLDAHSFVDNFDNSYENILFFGPVGTGKSFLSACIAKELLDSGHMVVYFSAQELFNLLSDIMFDKRDRQELIAQKDILYKSELLIIDDLGTELSNAATAAELFSILTDRNLKSNSTIISTNLELNQLKDRYDDRIFSRLIEMYSFKKISGPDIRRLKRTSK